MSVSELICSHSRSRQTSPGIERPLEIQCKSAEGLICSEFRKCQAENVTRDFSPIYEYSPSLSSTETIAAVDSCRRSNGWGEHEMAVSMYAQPAFCVVHCSLVQCLSIPSQHISNSAPQQHYQYQRLRVIKACSRTFFNPYYNTAYGLVGRV